MALDEPQDADERFDVDGIVVVMAREEARYLTRHGALRVDHVEGWSGPGFVVSQGHGSGC